MANSTSSGRKGKADENNNRCDGQIGPINSGSSIKDATGPRRSIRETSSKKMTPSPSSIRKSERLGKCTSLSPPVRRKSERVEKQKMPSPLRRSKRTKNQSDIASSGSKSLDSLALKQKKRKKHKSVKKITFEAEKAANEERDEGTSRVKRKRMDARAYRAMMKKKPKIDCPEETNGKENLIQEGGNNVEDKIDEHFKGSNLDSEDVSNNGMLPSDDAKELVNLSDVEDRGETEATVAAEISEKGVDCAPSNDVSTEVPADDGKICLICKRGGQLLFCHGKECGGCYHFSCLEPPMVDAPLGVWHCHLCLKKKIELGVYSVSEGVESIWDAREVKVSHADGWTTEKRFLVKYKGLAHVHNRWVPESQLLLEAPPSLLEKFNRKDQALKWKQEWRLPHCLLQKRALIFAQQDGDPWNGQAVGNSVCHYEWLVKWQGLGYEHASWELGNASFLRSLEGQRLIKDYEDCHQRLKRVPLSSKVDKVFDGSGNKPVLENEEVLRKRAKVFDADQPYSKREGEKLSAGNNEERPQGNDVEFLKARKSRHEQRRSHLSLKSEIAKLCEILHVPDNVKRMADEFLEYVMNNHRVDSSTLPKSILEAFQISLCWIAASLVKHKIDHEASLMLAKHHLKFDCWKDVANVIYSMLWCLKNIFLHRTGNYNVTDSPKASPSELSGKNYSCTGLGLEVELAKKDVFESIKEIRKKCQKTLRKLLLKHQEEKNKLDATYEEKKAHLEREYKIESAVIRYCAPNDVMRSEKLKDLDIEYTGRFEDLKHQHEIHLKDLENVQSMARKMLQNKEASWVEDVKSWAQDQLLTTLPSKEHGNGIEYLKTSEQTEPDNDPKNRGLVSNLVTEDTNFDRIVEAMTGTGVGSSRTPEIISPVVVQCSNPVKGQTPPVEIASAFEGHDGAQNVCNSQGKMISVHSHSQEHNVNGATCMINEGEGHDIFNDGCREKTVSDDLQKDITVDPPSSRELISDGSPLNVSDRELSSRQCESPLLPDQQTSDGVSLHMHDGQVSIEVPEPSRGIVECHNGREHQTDVILLDQTATSEEQKQMSRTMNNNTLSQALQDSHASLLTSPRMVDEDPTVGEIQNSSRPVEQASHPVDAIPPVQSNPESVMEPQEQMQQLPFVESLASNQDTAGAMQQVEAASTPFETLPAGEFNHDPVREPLEQPQQLPSTEPLASNLDTSGELLDTSQQVEPVCRQVDVAQTNGLNPESLVGEILQQMQQLPSAESPNSTHDRSMAPEIELRSNNEDFPSGHVPPASMEVTNQAVVHPSSNFEPHSHSPVSEFRTQSLDTINVFTPSEINNQRRQTATQSTNRMRSPFVSDPLKNELDRLHKESEQTMKYYEDMKLQLKSDCERELEEIRRKYDIKLQESELEFQQKKKNLDTSLNLVLMNKMWAEAFRSKCMDLRASGASGMQQDPGFAPQLTWFSRQQSDMRPSLVASPPLGAPASTPQHFATAATSQTMAPPHVSSMPILMSSPMVPPISSIAISQATAPPLLASYTAPPRPPQINSISPLANHQVGSGFRSTPPHLQPYRPSTSLPDWSQQAPNNIPIMPSLPNHPRPTLPTNISDPHNRVHRPEIPVVLSNPSLSAREPAMDGNSQLGMNLANTLLRSSNATSLQQSELGTARRVQDDSLRPAMSPHIVCLSDDD